MVLLGVGQPGNDVRSVMVAVTRFPTTSPRVLWDGLPHSHVVLVLLLAALVLVMSRETTLSSPEQHQTTAQSKRAAQHQNQHLGNHIKQQDA